MDYPILPLLTPILTGCVLAAIIWAFKLPALLKDNTDAIRGLTAKVEDLFNELDGVHKKIDHHSSQLSVQNKMWSDLLETPIDTGRIATDFEHYPSSAVFSRIKRRDA